MKRLNSMTWLTKLLVVIVATIAIVCGPLSDDGKTKTSDKFEMIRAYIQTWLSEASNDRLIISSARLKEKIVENWGNQSKKYQIVSVRKPDDYDRAGHIPNAINSYWIDTATDESLARLDSNKTLILYCYYGHGSLLSSTILSLLGYRCKSLDFGIMDWNLDALVKEPWDQTADYGMETTVNRPKELYPAPVIVSDQTDAKSIIKEMARKYLAGEGSPIIRSSGVKAIVDNWDQKKTEYQIVDVRSERDYETGHVPNAINIPWAEIAETENLRKLDPHRTVITCSDNGQMGQVATTVLSLLGYHAVNMLFGMMDWNQTSVDRSKQWDGVADYPVEYGQQFSPENLNSR
jgi:rhodanese-related sulfurtransferase